MKRKSLIIVVCLALMLSGFTTALAGDAETITTVTCKPGSLLADDAGLVQLCESAAIRIRSMPEGYGALEVLLNDTNVLSGLFRFEEDGMYLQSQIFGETPLYFNWEDLAGLLMEQLENNPDIQAAGTMIDTDMMRSMMDGSMTDEQALAMMGIDETLLEYVGDIQASQTVETGEFTLDGSDVANQKTVITLTKDDLARAFDLPFVRKQIGNQVMISSPYLTEEEAEQMMDEQFAEIKQEILDNNLNVTISVYTNDDAFVAFAFSVTGASEISDVGVHLTITKTTIEKAEFYQMALRLVEGKQEYLNQSGSLYLSDEFVTGKYVIYSIDNAPAFAAAIDCDVSQPGQTLGQLSFTVYDSYYGTQDSVLIVFSQDKDGETTDTAVDVYAGGSVDDIKASLAATDLISFAFRSVTQPDSGLYSALQNAIPETAVQLSKMSEEELSAFSAGMEQNYVMLYLTLMDNLPPEIRDSLMPAMGGK